MPEESRKLMEIYRSHPEMNMLQVIDEYASAEYKALINEPDDIKETD